MKKPAVITAMLLFGLPAGVAGLSGPTQAAEFSCRGLAATLVGSPGTTIHGTSGADVIVTNGADRVEADAGDDVICTTNTPPADTTLGQDAITVFAGSGNDVVDRSGDPDPAADSLTSLDDGDDTYLGGPASDAVNSTDSGADTIDTGAGNDLVLTGSINGPAPTGADDVDLGDGDDSFSVAGSRTSVAPELTVTGGAGGDHLDLSALGRGQWIIDAPHQEATRDGARAFGFAEMESYSLGTHNPGASGFRFVGTAANETVSVVRPASRTEPISVRATITSPCWACSTGRRTRRPPTPSREGQGRTPSPSKPSTRTSTSASGVIASTTA
jgi:hypothetical protein